MSRMNSNGIPLEREKLIFPLYRYGTKKYVPLKFALPIAYLVPTILIIILSPITYSNAILFQIEFILIALFYGLLGILTRSKLRSLLNFIPAILSYITVDIVVQGILKFNPPINDPYAGFNIASGPIKDILINLGAPNNITSYAGFIFLADILFILLIAEIGGFFTAMLSTGFWNPRGEFSALAVVAKIIAIPLVLIFIIVLPIVLHGVSSVVTGGSYFGAGVTELEQIFNPTTGGKAAQSVDLNTLNITALKEHSLKAAEYFSLANNRLSQLGGNLIVQGVISLMIQSYPQLEGFKNITNVLGLVGSLSEVTYVLPELFLGFKSLQVGFQETIPIITRGDLSYDPGFAQGLKEINYAFGNFTEAMNMTINGKQHGITQALQDALPLKDIQSLSNYLNVQDFFNALEISTNALLKIGPSFTAFLNGTYETTIGLANLGANNFTLSNYWMANAIADFKVSNNTLANIPTPPTVQFSVYSDGKGGAGQNQTIEIPVDGVVKIAKDMNALLIPFAYASLSGVNLFENMDTVMTQMSNQNWNDTITSADQTYWNNVNTSVYTVRNYYQFGVNNLTLAGNLASQDSQKSYGSLLDSAFTQGSNSFFASLANEITKLSTNFTNYGHMFDAFVNTSYSLRFFAYGSDLFSQWSTEYGSNNNSTLAISLHDQAIANFTISQTYASEGKSALDLASGINQDVKTKWIGFLVGTLSQPYSIYNADASGILLLSTYNTAPTAYLNYIDQIHLGDILGTG